MADAKFLEKRLRNSPGLEQKARDSVKVLQMMIIWWKTT